ncbi:hypothetical protein VPHPS15B6_0083 [Vibrio phage PS15B-6]
MRAFLCQFINSMCVRAFAASTAISQKVSNKLQINTRAI